MKIKFINKNNSEKENDVTIHNINLSTHNPRYTTLNSIDENLIKKIEDLGKKNQEEVMNELLSNEGDFSDFGNLLTSILKTSFNSQTEPIILIKNENKYIVAEGNRRLMSLKLISKELELPKIIELIEDIDNNQNLDYEDEEKNNNYRKRRKENYEKIKQIKEEIIQKYSDEEIKVHYIIVKEDKELWKEIYTKHVAGDRPGMRQWTRGKYFTDILSFFKRGISINDDEINNKVRTLLQREPTTIIEDFKHAQFIKAILKEAKIYDVKYEEITDKKIFEVMKKIKVSALQYNFSLKKVKDAAKQFLKIDNEEFKEKYFNFSFDEKNLITFDKDKKVKEILELIYDYFNKGILTTRPMAENYKNDFNLDVKKILNSINIDTKKPQSKETLEKIDSFDYKIKKLDEIIKNAENNNIDKINIERFIYTKKIKENSEKIKKIKFRISSANEPASVFKILIDQYLQNCKNVFFLNAMAATLRSILEQIFIWGGYYSDEIVKTIISDSSDIKSKKNSYVREISKSKIHKLFLKIRKNNWNPIDIAEIINSIVKKTFDSKNIINFLFNNKNDINKVLNEMIHASHRIYNKKTVNIFLKKISEWQKNIFLIIENIDYDKIEKLNCKIKNILTN